MAYSRLMNRNSRLCSVYVLLIAECVTPRCHESEAKYVCPECKIAYCSTKCFNVESRLQ